MLGGEKGEVPQPVVYEENDAPEKLYTERVMSVSAPQFLLGAAYRPTEGDGFCAEHPRRSTPGFTARGS